MSQALDSADLAVVYDGEALREHLMSVRDLAPALLGLADVFQLAHETLSPGEPPVTLEIRATDEGSFLVELSLLHEQTVRLLDNPDSLAVATLIVFVTGARGVFNFFRNRRRGTAEEQLPNGTVRITLPDGTVIEFPPEVLALSRQPGIRKGVQAVVAPLDREGIDTLQMRETPTSEPTVTITSDDLGLLAEAMEDEGRTLLVDQQYDQLLTVTSPNFQPGNKWRLTEGRGPAPWFWMTMDDPAFLSRIDSGEVAFRKNDRLLAKVWLRQWESESGEIHTDRSIVRVLRHLPRPAAVQGELFEDDRHAAPSDPTPNEPSS